MCHNGYLALAVHRIVVRVSCWLAVAALIACARQAQAQWISQTNSLKPGWNAVFLHVDASHATLDELVGNDSANPIQEIWYWRPSLPTDQFVTSPQFPSGGGSQWTTWTRAAGPTSNLKRLTGNGAYLVKVAGTSSYGWKVKGKPVMPTFRWTLTGLNFIGFPTPPAAPPAFDAFLLPAPQLQQNAEIYRYQGGELSATNPVRVLALRTTGVQRDQAYWARAGESYNQYFGPIQILQASPSGIHFGNARGQAQLRLRNLANSAITITLRTVASETPPPGQSNILAAPPLLLRGAINNTNLTFGYTALGAGSQVWNLAAAGEVGSEVELILGLNRSQMTGAPGSLYAGILRFTDSLGLSQIDMSISAEKESAAGLWVGGAQINYVSHYLKPYAKTTNDTDFAALLARLQIVEGANGYHYERDPNTGRVLVFGGPERKTGSYLLDGPIKIDSGAVANPFQVRLILHNDGGASKLLQKVFYGMGASSNFVVATREALLLPSRLADARRISSVHFPASAGNTPWNFTGLIQPGGNITALVPLSHDDQSSNPFLHTYHPDHDNLDAQFAAVLPQGAESYGITRQISLSFTAPEDNFTSLTQSSQDLSGNYGETIIFGARGSQTRQYNVLGTFSLKRITDIATLTSN